jgi:uncharacterized membrane protein
MWLAFGLRVYRLAGQSIWYDEGLSVYYARRPLPELLALVAGSDHPPLYFLLLHAWLRVVAFGQPATEFLVRYPSVIFGVLLVPLVYVFGCRLLNGSAARLAGLLIALSPFHVWYSQETRMYTLVAFLTLLSTYRLSLIVNRLSPIAYRQSPIVNRQSSISNIQYPIYSFITALALYAHFYAGLILIAHAAFVTGWAWRRARWQVWLRWAGATAVAVLIFLPWGGLAAGQLQANDTYWRGTLALGHTLSQTARAFAVGEITGGPIAVLTTVAYLSLVAIGLSAIVKRSLPGRECSPSDSVTLLLVYVLVPLVVLLAISYNRPKFAPRYLLIVMPALALLVGQGVVTLGRRMTALRLQSLRSAVAGVLMGVVVAGSSLSLWQHYTDAAQFKADWRAAARYINQHASPRDAVVIVAGHAMPAFDFYNARQLDVYPIPPRLLPTVNDPVEFADVMATLNRLVQKDHARAWLILWQEPLADPRRLTLNQLFEHGRRLGVNAGFHDLGVLLFELPPGTVFKPPRPEHGLDAVFGRQLHLEGYDLSSSSAAPGDTLSLSLYWQAVEPISRDYTAFTQLLSTEDEIVGQHDRRLGGDFYPTSRWTVGELVRETYALTIQPDTPPGRYRLVAGAYLPPTGPRLPVEGRNAAGDHVVIAEITVGPRP